MPINPSLSIVPRQQLPLRPPPTRRNTQTSPTDSRYKPVTLPIVA